MEVKISLTHICCQRYDLISRALMIIQKDLKLDNLDMKKLEIKTDSIEHLVINYKE